MQFFILNIPWHELKTVLLVLLQIATILTIVFIVFSILLEKRDPLRTISWILVILLIPLIGLVFYFYFGRNYRKQKIFNRKIVSDFEQLEKLKKIQHSISDQISSASRKIQSKSNIIKLLINNNKALLTENNELKILSNGEETFYFIKQELEKATDHIHLEYYIIEEDNIGKEIQQILIKKAKQGITVRLIYDDIGSWSLSTQYIDELEEAGVEVHSFMPVRFYRLASKINYRNHRKIIVIDGKVGFVGGLNIADRYIYGDAEVGFWRDTHLQISGEAVHSLQLIFLMDWYFVSEQFIHHDKYFPDPKIEKKCLVQIATSGPDSDWASIMQTFFYAISTAKKSVYISTPYFIPNESILTALKTVAMSGVSVKIIIPSRSDSFISYWGTMSYVEELLEAGIGVYMYNKGFTHSKILIVDDILCSIGTANMDIRSFDENFEVTALIYNEETSCKLKKIFLEDITNCIELTYKIYENRPFSHKLKEAITKVFSPLW